MKAAASLYVGLITGTSMDGIDGALVRVDGAGEVTLLHGQTISLDPDLAACLQQLVASPEVSLDRLCEADAWLGEALADATLELLAGAGVSRTEVAAVGSHGQTVHHRPMGPHASTLQIGDPNIIAERTGLTTVADLRRRDMAAGGQGAPLLPALHQRLLGHETETRVVLNLGGIANVTRLPAGNANPSHGFDTGPANTLLDLWARRHLGQAFDRDGAWSRTGRPDDGLMAALLEEPYFALMPPKSTGRELFNLTWLEGVLRRYGAEPSPADVQATLVALVAASVRDGVAMTGAPPDRVLAAGGGVHNGALMDALRAALPAPVETVDSHGVSADTLEAMAFAWFAWARLAGVPIAPAAVTGASRQVVLGALYPGSDGE